MTSAGGPDGPDGGGLFEPKSVEMEFIDPGAGIRDEELADTGRVLAGPEGEAVELGPVRRNLWLQRSRLEYLVRSEAAQRSLAENYVGLPAEPAF